MAARALRPVLGIVVAREVQVAVARHVREWGPRYAAALRAYARAIDDREVGILRKAIEDDADHVSNISLAGTKTALVDGRQISSRHVPEAIAKRAEELAGGSASDRAADWARERSANLVVGITDGTRQSVRRVLAAGQDGRLSDPSVRKALREVLPLDPRRATALVNFRSRLESQGMEAARIDALADRYARRLVAQRADAVARTEGARAIAEGRLDLWRDLAQEGTVQEKHVVRQWTTMRDEGVDAQCEDLDGEIAGLDGGYSTADAPPAHVNCRCSEVIRLLSEE